jgi:glycogen debranching enzyme
MHENIRPELVQIRPRTGQHYISNGHTVLIAGENGFIEEKNKEGLLIYQTRAISQYRYLIDGREPKPVSLSPVHENSWMGYYIAPEPGEGDALKRTIELRISRFAGHGFHEEIDLTNFSRDTVRFNLALEVNADFVDQSEMGKAKKTVRGRLSQNWRHAGGQWELGFDFKAKHRYDHQGKRGVAKFHQSITLRIEHSQSSPSYKAGKILFPVELKPHGRWHACLNAIPALGGHILQPLYRCHAFGQVSPPAAEREKFLTVDAARFSTPESSTLSSVVMQTVRRATRDLAALRLDDPDEGGSWIPAAGLPEYVALFGRDSISSSWQASLLSTAMLRATLPMLASLQGTEDNPWRDEEPGKMIHQAADGLLAQLKFVPFGRYYGSLTTSAVYPFALAALWQWTGDANLIRPYIDPALKALHWLETGGDLDGDGFSEYLCRSKGGLRNQGWKDSGGAIVEADGSLAEPPIAPCEEQGFLYIARMRMAEMLWWLDEKDQAQRLFHKARELKKRFNEAFWMEEEGFFAMGLDGGKRQIRSISSNPGHLLETAIVDDSLARRTADRLMSADLFSGWGVRTLSEKHPAYDPYSYQRGSVWPVENGLFAMGMLRYGLHHYAERICRGLFEAAALFEHNRLPEVFAGHPRDPEHPFPPVYPDANWPQAWSSAAVFCLLYSMLGIFPYAPLNAFFVDPHLPEWLPEITLSNLHIGQAVASIRFFRTPDGSSDYRVVDLTGKLHVVRQPSPWSLTATLGERFQDALMSFTPGR